MRFGVRFYGNRLYIFRVDRSNQTLDSNKMLRTSINTNELKYKPQKCRCIEFSAPYPHDENEVLSEISQNQVDAEASIACDRREVSLVQRWIGLLIFACGSSFRRIRERLQHQQQPRVTQSEEQNPSLFRQFVEYQLS